MKNNCEYIESAILRFCVEVLLKILDFGYFVPIWWKTYKKQEILKQSCKDLFVLVELPILCDEVDELYDLLSDPKIFSA